MAWSPDGLAENGKMWQPGQDAQPSSTQPAPIAKEVQFSQLFESGQRAKVPHLQTVGQV